VRRIFPQAIAIFVLPPSLAALEMRLRLRAQDSPEAIGRRLAAAREEINHVREYDYVIINEELNHTSHELRCIVQAERLRTARQLAHHRNLITQLGSISVP